MIDYKLAKQLKDSGFPQGEEINVGQQWYDNHDKDCPSLTDEAHEKNICPDDVCTCEEGHEIYIPTLSELIEACGEYGEVNITRYTSGKAEAHIPGTDYEEDGNNLEIAVAKLYIELNK